MRRQILDLRHRVAEASDPITAISLIVGSTVDFFNRHPEFLELLATLDLNSPDVSGSTFRPHREAFIATVWGVLERLDASGTLDVADPSLSASCLC